MSKTHRTRGILTYFNDTLSSSVRYRVEKKQNVHRFAGYFDFSNKILSFQQFIFVTYSISRGITFAPKLKN